MRTYILSILCAASLAAAYGTAGIAVERAIAAPTCSEDSPCWNWATMGNHQRGWVSTWGTSKHGTACHFQRAVRLHRVFGYSRGLQHMRGDRTALSAACN